MEYLSEKMKTLLKFRIEQEELSSRLYQSMAQFLEFNGFEGAAKLWYKYSDEESTHAKLITQFMLDLDYLPPMPTIREPQLEFDGLEDIINKSYEHEVLVTNQCKDLAIQAFKENDLLTYGIAQRLVNEQVEELAKTTLWKDKIESFGSDKIALKLLDQEMGEAAQ